MEEELATAAKRAEKSSTPATPPPTATSPGPDEEQDMLFDYGQPTCPNCGAVVDDASSQTGKCYVCDESFDPTSLVDVDEAEEPLDDQTELPFSD